MPDDILTVEQAAEVLQMHPYTIRKMLREGTLPGRKLGVKEWRIARSQLDAFMRGELQPIPKAQPEESAPQKAARKPAAKKAPGKRGKKS